MPLFGLPSSHHMQFGRCLVTWGKRSRDSS